MWKGPGCGLWAGPGRESHRPAVGCKVKAGTGDYDYRMCGGGGSSKINTIINVVFLYCLKSYNLIIFIIIS